MALRALSLCEGFGLRRIPFHVGRVESDLGVLGVGLLFVLERNKRRNEVGVGEVVVAVRVEASKYGNHVLIRDEGVALLSDEKLELFLGDVGSAVADAVERLNEVEALDAKKLFAVSL